MANHAVTQCSTFPHFAKWPMGTQLAYHGGVQFAQTQFINTVWTSLVGWNDSNCTSNTIDTVYIIYIYLWYTWSKYRSVELDWASNSFIIWENIGINKFNFTSKVSGVKEKENLLPIHHFYIPCSLSSMSHCCFRNESFRVPSSRDPDIIIQPMWLNLCNHWKSVETK